MVLEHGNAPGSIGYQPIALLLSYTRKKWRTERYHAPSDDLAQPIDRQAAADFNRLYLELIEAVANRPERPRWNGDSFFKRFAE